MKPRTLEQEINDLICIARRWRKAAELELTGENDEFLRLELEEKYDEWLYPWLKCLTKDDNEFRRHGIHVEDNLTILTLEIRKAALEKLIRENYKPKWWEKFYVKRR